MHRKSQPVLRAVVAFVGMFVERGDSTRCIAS